MPVAGNFKFILIYTKGGIAKMIQFPLLSEVCTAQRDFGMLGVGTTTEVRAVRSCDQEGADDVVNVSVICV